MAYTPEECLKSLKKADQKTDGDLTFRDYQNLDILPSTDTIIRNFGSFNHAKEQAGIDTQEQPGKDKSAYPTVQMIVCDGYSTVRVRDPYEDIRKDVKVHRLMMAAERGPDEVEGMHVHHENKIKFDNRPENLELMTPKEHHSMHATELHRNGSLG